MYILRMSNCTKSEKEKAKFNINSSLNFGSPSKLLSTLLQKAAENFVCSNQPDDKYLGLQSQSKERTKPKFNVQVYVIMISMLILIKITLTRFIQTHKFK